MLQNISICVFLCSLPQRLMESPISKGYPQYPKGKPKIVTFFKYVTFTTKYLDFGTILILMTVSKLTFIKTMRSTLTSRLEVIQIYIQNTQFFKNETDVVFVGKYDV